MCDNNKEKINIVAIESGNEGDSDSYTSEQVISHWVSPLDISNVTPKVVFALDERDGDLLFEFSYFVTMCSTICSRTKCITFIPRFQIVNLLKRNLYVVQNRCLNEIYVSAQSSIFYHWESVQDRCLNEISIPAQSSLLFSLLTSPSFDDGKKLSFNLTFTLFQ